MPGAQPRRAFESRIGSTARRGAYAPPGVPGVYRVPRSRVVTVASDPGRPAVAANPWIQGPDYDIELALTGTQTWYTVTPLVAPGARSDVDFAIDIGEGEDLDAAPSLSSLVQSVLATDYQMLWAPDASAINAASNRGHVGIAASGLLTIEFGSTHGYTYPDFPPGADNIEYETEASVFTGPATLTAEAYSSDGSTDATPETSGHLWVGQTPTSPFRPVSEIVADDTQVGASWSGATPSPWSAVTTADALFGPSPESGTMRLTVLTDAVTIPGSVARQPTSTLHATAIAALDDLTLTATLTPPRHRFLYP